MSWVVQYEHDEGTPLLVSGRFSAKKPIRAQNTHLTILLVLCLVEPLPCTIIYPFIPKLISELPMVHGEPIKIGFYLGLFYGLPFLTQVLTARYWTRLGDKYGQRLAILFGYIRLAIATICFGFSKSLVGLLLSRALQGTMKASVTTIKTTVGDEASMAHLYPIVAAAGSALGMLIGGILEHPADRFPVVFGKRLWGEYPYLLPCVAAASVVSTRLVVALLFLQDSPSRAGDTRMMLGEHHGATAIATSPSKAGQSGSFVEDPTVPKPHRFSQTPTIIIVNHALLITLQVSFYPLISLFLATPIYLGGLGFQPPIIGLVLGVLASVHAYAHTRFKFNTRWASSVRVAAFGPLYLCLPVMNAFARRWGVGWQVWGVVVVQAVLFLISLIGFCLMDIAVTRGNPSCDHLIGGMDIFEQTIYTSMGTLGPIFSTILFAITKEYNILGGTFVYSVLISLSAIVVGLGTCFPEQNDKGSCLQ